MRRCVLAAVVALVGCAEQGPLRTNVPQAKQEGRPGSTGEPAGVTAALRTARERAELAIALVPPKYTDRGEKAEALAYMQGPLAQWIKRRRQLQEAALAEYERAQAHTPPALLYASEEVGKLQADFAEHFVTASISAMPPSIRDSAPMSVAFENAIREAAEPQLAAARAAFTRCASEARTAKLELLKARCDKRLAALPRVHADVSPELSPNLADAKARPWLKTRQPRACVYAGSLETYAPVFASIDDAQPVAHLAGAFAVEVDELTPATSDGGRTRIDLSWPVRAT